jgi:ABC-type multidrug transport system ATPase subunit
MITVRQLTKAFGTTTALAGVDLEIGQGECLAIVGSHGSGRTTLLRILATLVRPTSGRVEINGVDTAADLSRVRPLVAYAGHERIDGNRLRVDEYLRFVAAARKRPVSSTGSIAALVGLDPRAPIATLTGDVQPRLALAAALMAAPAVLLLDEPFPLLDTGARPGFVQWLRAARDGGATIVMSAGAAEDVSELCQRAARLESGRVVDVDASHLAVSANDSRPPELVGA